MLLKPGKFYNLRFTIPGIMRVAFHSLKSFIGLCFGFEKQYITVFSYQGFTHDFDGQNVIVGFGGDERTNLSDPHFPLVAITRYGTDGGVREIAVNYHYDTGAEYTINGSGPRLSFDSIPILAYIFENFGLDNKDPFSDLFEAYRIPKEQQRASWKEYTLP